MSQESLDETLVLEKKFDKALEEATYKVGLASESSRRPADEFEMNIRLAAEAAEYSSALFSLTHSLGDVYPDFKIDKKAEPSLLISESAEALKKAGELRRSSKVEAYANLRKAADYLKTAYFNQVKKSRKRAS